jgi:hypothetical protein
MKFARYAISIILSADCRAIMFICCIYICVSCFPWCFLWECMYMMRIVQKWLIPANLLFAGGSPFLCTQDICSSLISGFNQTLLSLGTSKLGKSTRLFGRFAWPASQMKGPCCILTAILRRLLSRANYEKGKLQVALSCWEVSCEQVNVLISLRVRLQP